MFFLNHNVQFFWTNVDGVYENYFQHNNLKLIKQIYVNNKGKPIIDLDLLNKLKNPIIIKQTCEEKETENNQDVKQNNATMYDATGGMWNKIEVSSRCCAHGTDVTICKGGNIESLNAILGKCVEIGTIFIHDPSV